MNVQTGGLVAGGLSSAALAFLVRAALWNLALFAFIRLAWVDRHLVGLLVELQTTLVYWYGTTPHPGIVVNSSCSGADVMALCAGVTLAYPVAWRKRLVGAAIGLAGVLALNALRIASLHAVASTPSTLELLHVYVWPALLAAATVLYLLAWIRWTTRSTNAPGLRTARVVAAALAALVAYAVAVPWAFTSSTLYQVGAVTAATGAALLSGLGATAQATGHVIVTGRGVFAVTPECLFTPMIPMYLAGVFALPLDRRRRWLWLMAAAPLFFALGVARLLVLAVPTSVAEVPAFLAHGFYQFVAAVVAIVAAAHLALRRESAGAASRRTLAALALALVAGIGAAYVWHPVLVTAAEGLQALVPSTVTALAAGGDRQGALALLPAFQVGLAAGLWIALSGGRTFGWLLGGLVALFLTQAAFLVGLGALSAWVDAAPHALVVRAWAVGVPLLVATTWVARDATSLGDGAYRQFWHEVGDEFPDLAGAASTAYYFENEKRLLTEALPALAGCTLLKTDLWDEAKNTRIMQWAADQGARVYGIDLSEPIVRAARTEFGGRPLRPAVSDVRRIPFADASFDVIYSMGTVEHFAETDVAVAELARVLKPGGCLVLGVPNRHDPFLRPLMVAGLDRLGLYGYGYEKSYSRRRLREMLDRAGLHVTMESGILFMPGWLRMADLWCHTRRRWRLARLTGAIVRAFAWIDQRVPAARRHGYLLASVGVKRPAGPRPPARTVEPDLEGSPVWQLPAVDPAAAVAPSTGTEVVVDARGCDPRALQSLPRLERLFTDVLADLALRPLAPPVWHVFPGHGGVTGMVLLAESHLTIHTYPERNLAALNLYCCRALVEWAWESRLQELLGATDVSVRVLSRG